MSEHRWLCAAVSMTLFTAAYATPVLTRAAYAADTPAPAAIKAGQNARTARSGNIYGVDPGNVVPITKTNRWNNRFSARMHTRTRAPLHTSPVQHPQH